MIKKFYCGLCKEHKRYAMPRHIFRNHLAKEHLITSNKTNSVVKEGYKQKWWIMEEFK